MRFCYSNRGNCIRVKENANYTVLMNAVDVDSLIQGKQVSFWIN